MLAKQIILSRYNNKPEPFKKIEFPTLSSIAIQVVADNFELYPHLTGVPEMIKQQIIDKASKTLPVVITYNSISDEQYWKQACDARWKGSHRTINILKHSNSYKIAYMENYLEEYLRGLREIIPQDKDKDKDKEKEKLNQKEELIKQLKAVSNWIFTLNISQTRVYIDIGLICLYLPCLSNLTIKYGLKTEGNNYKKNTLGMRLNHSAELAEALSKNCNNLHTLQLPSNLIDDDLLRFILAGVNNNISIVELNLSHNKIDDKGAKRIAQFLLQTEILINLDLSNNYIGFEGSRFIGWAIRINKSLKSLNLGLNALTDKAGMKFFLDLTGNREIQTLNLMGNQLGSQSAIKISDYLADSQCTLQNLNVANNNFSTDQDYEILKQGLNKNTSLLYFDIRNAQFSKKQYEQDLMDIVIQARLKSQNIPFVNRDDYSLQQAQALLRKEKQEKQNIKTNNEIPQQE